MVSFHHLCLVDIEIWKYSICNVFPHWDYSFEDKIYLLSGSNLHSLFLWPQNCTYLLTADPETESREPPAHKKRSHLHVAVISPWHCGPFVSDTCTRDINQAGSKGAQGWIILKWLWLVTHPTNLHPIGCLLHLLSQGLGLGAGLQRAGVTGRLGWLLISEVKKKKKKAIALVHWICHAFCHTSCTDV